MFRAFKVGLVFGIGASVLLTAGLACAKVTWNLQPAGTGTWDWSLVQHWTFNRPGAPGEPNYHSIGSDDDRNNAWGFSDPTEIAAPECLEITTSPGSGGRNTDTVIEVQDTGYNWQVVSDDFGGTYQSHARIWIQPVTSTMAFALRVRAYSSYSNSDDFFITTTRRDFGSSQDPKASCTSGQTAIPWVQITDSPHFTVTLSSFH